MKKSLILQKPALVFLTCCILLAGFYWYSQSNKTNEPLLKETKKIDPGAWIANGKSYQFEQFVDNVYVMIGDLGYPSSQTINLTINVGLIVGKNGLIVIDSGGSKAIGKKIIEQIKRISDKPVVALFNTTIHSDHWLGNDAFIQAYPDIKIYGNFALIHRLNQGGGQLWFDRLHNLIPKQLDDTKMVYPSYPVPSRALLIDSEEFQVFGVLRGEGLDTNIVIYHTQTAVFFLGELLTVNRLGEMDEGMSVANTIKVLKEFMWMGSGYAVPGHGKSGEMNSTARPYLEYLTLLHQLVSRAYKKEILSYELREELIEEFDDYQDWVNFDLNIGRNMTRVYSEIEEQDLQ